MLDNWGAGLQGCHSYHYCCNAYNLIYVKKTNLHQRSKISAACVHSFRNDGKQQLLHMNNGFDKQNSSICWYYTKNCLVPEWNCIKGLLNFVTESNLGVPLRLQVCRQDILPLSPVQNICYVYALFTRMVCPSNSWNGIQLKNNKKHGKIF
jgi:hypothetical protein